MGVKKRLLKHPMLQAVFAWLLSLYIRFVFLTSRITMKVEEGSQPYVDGKDNAIFAFWHGRMVAMPMKTPPDRKMHVLISLHRDGMLISKVVEYLNVATINGSTSRGGREAIKVILQTLRAGDNVGITPDGPRGPNQVASKGIETIARISGKPIIPCAFSSTRTHRFRSWDRFMLALPFGHIVFFVGSPITIEKNADDATQAKLLLQIEDIMNQLVTQADLFTHAK